MGPRQMKRTFYEFFAGGGMARCGLGSQWRCLFANDIDENKVRSYRSYFGASSEYLLRDIAKVRPDDVPGIADLAWASFPCQDLSLAGNGAGLNGDRSGTFWPFWRIVSGLISDGRAPRIVALENVYGTLTSHQGRDFSAICDALSEAGYQVGAMVIDARYFVPQSRPRLFVVGARKGIRLPPFTFAQGPVQPWHPPAIISALHRIRHLAASDWVWWTMAPPPSRQQKFSELIEEHPNSVQWHTAEETQRLLNMMSAINRAKVAAAKALRHRVIGGVYKRTRLDDSGKRVQRAEVRFDEISGCLRTPAGGSSRQTILVVEGQRVRSRLLSPREAARLMGLPDDYELPQNYNTAYHLAGDGVVVPVVRYLAKQILEPILEYHEAHPRRAQQPQRRYRSQAVIA